MEEMTWFCQICNLERPDDKVGVLSYNLKGSKGKTISNITVNIKYCKDNPLCYKGALRKKEKGEL